jgi:photosystem II stability/assembly factor-like uncharacterized protein
MKLRSIAIIIVVLLEQAGAMQGYAQPMKWKISAPNILSPLFLGNKKTEFGAIAAKNKTVLAGWKNLALSGDGGLTWRSIGSAVPGGDFVTDIAIYDDRTFAIMTFYHGVYRSGDQGNSWQNVDNNPDGLSLVFDGSPTRIVATHNSNVGFVIEAGRIQTQFVIPIAFGSCIRVAGDGSLRIFGADGGNASLFTSYDHALSWVRGTQIVQEDDYTIIADPVDPMRFVVTNENWVYRLAGVSNIFLTTDNGNEWTTVYSHLLGSYADISGNGAAGCHDYFTGTQNNGILRSTDKGLSWNSIGGPVTTVDSRNVAAIDDSIIFAVDTLGTIWVTDATPGTYGSPQVLGGQFFNRLSVGSCDTTIIAPIYLLNTACIKYDIAKIEITGNDASFFSIVQNIHYPFTYPDSIIVGFTPLRSGVMDAKLKVTYSDGSNTIVDIGGANVTTMPVFISKPSLFDGDTIAICSRKNTTVSLRAPCSLDVSAISIIGKDSASFAIGGKHSGTLPADSLINVLCIPQNTGKLSASLHIVLRDGRIIDVPLDIVITGTPLTYSPAVLFAKDTITICSSDSSVIALRSPCAMDITSIKITGYDTASFSLGGKDSLSLPADSLIKVICIPQHSGNLNALLHFVARDGRAFDVPMNIVVTLAPLLTSLTPFAKDTILSCSSDSSVIALHSVCSLDLSSITITGTDAASFSSSRTNASLPVDSLIRIHCIPQHAGDLHADIHIVSSDGRTWNVPVDIVVKPTPLFYRQSHFIGKDTITTCSSDSTVIILSSPCALDISEISFSGADALSFFLSGKNSASLPQDSLIRIICIPQHAGELIATVQAKSTDGRTWDIPITIVAYDPPLLLEPANLFIKDSLAFCSAGIDSVLLKDICPLDISSATLTGADATSFTIKGKSSFHYPKDSLIIINCIPLHGGTLSASLHLVSATGRAWDVPLNPYVIPKSTIAFDNLSDAYTDVVGGDITIPIVFHSTGLPEDAGFSLHYDTTSLVYHGVFGQSNTDHTSSYPDGRTARITFNTGSDTIFLAKFSFFPVDSSCTKITIDSLTGEQSSANCLSIFSSASTAEICSPAECGRSILARYVKNGALPELSISPNPSSGVFTITSTQPLGLVKISIFDKLGIMMISEYRNISHNENAQFYLESLPSGLYFIRVSSLIAVVPIIIEK